MLGEIAAERASNVPDFLVQATEQLAASRSEQGQDRRALVA